MSSKNLMMLVSKEHMSNVKKLYKMLFKLHKSLPDEIRPLGDAYVRSEFKLHKQATPEQTAKFMSEWTNYALTLAKQLDPKRNIKLGIKLDEKNLDDFTEDQIKQLYELFLETTKPKD